MSAPEVLFLIARFLSNIPALSHSSSVLQQELSGGLLGTGFDWRGDETPITYNDLAIRFEKLTGSHLQGLMPSGPSSSLLHKQHLLGVVDPAPHATELRETVIRLSLTLAHLRLARLGLSLTEREISEASESFDISPTSSSAEDTAARRRVCRISHFYPRPHNTFSKVLTARRHGSELERSITERAKEEGDLRGKQASAMLVARKAGLTLSSRDPRGGILPLLAAARARGSMGRGGPCARHIMHARYQPSKV